MQPTPIMKGFFTFSFVLLMGIMLSLNGQVVPVFTIEKAKTTASSSTVSITAVGFSNISSGNLTVFYNPAVAKPSTVTTGTGLGGSLNFNLSNSGEIIIGWYTFPSVTFVDGSVIFSIEFDKVSEGTSPVSFIETTDDLDCQFYDGSYQKLNDAPFSTYYKSGSVTFEEYVSPVTIVPNFTANKNEIINVPVTVTDFKNIGAVSLRLDYDPEVLSYNSAANTGGFPGLIINKPAPGTLTISGTTSHQEGYSLPDNSVFFTLNFTYLGGATGLNWFDGDGTSCEYAGPKSAFKLTDIPQSTYYINGSVGPHQATPEIAVGTVTKPTTCGGNGIIPLTFTNVPDGTYIINFDGGSFPNIDVSASAAVISAPAGIYNDLQITVNGETSVSGVNVVLTDPESPIQPMITAGGPTSFCEGGNVVLTSSEALKYQWSTGETTQSITVSASGNYSVTVLNASGCSATSEVLEVIVNARPEKPVKVNCWDEFIFNINTCTWENSGVKPAEPAKVNCWDDFQFSVTLCAWENKGIEPVKPESVNCWDEFVFNSITCVWENTGTKPVEPTPVNCWDEFTFNTNTCIWENSGVKPAEPVKVNCWDDFRFNKTLCVWENKGTEPLKPATVNCWDDFSFNTNSCKWENIGVKPEKPELVNCWDDYQFVEANCAWENIGTKPVEPTPLKSWDEFIFNPVSCAWENIGIATGVEINIHAVEMTLTCYPNPMKDKANIQYLLPENGKVNIEVTGIFGNRIKILSNQFQPAGEYLLDLDGERLASGLYQITLRLTDINGGAWTKTIRMIKQ